MLKQQNENNVKYAIGKKRDTCNKTQLNINMQ